jgi:hypothetical protein
VRGIHDVLRGYTGVPIVWMAMSGKIRRNVTIIIIIIIKQAGLSLNDTDLHSGETCFESWPEKNDYRDKVFCDFRQPYKHAYAEILS